MASDLDIAALRGYVNDCGKVTAIALGRHSVIALLDAAEQLQAVTAERDKIAAELAEERDDRRAVASLNVDEYERVKAQRDALLAAVCEYDKQLLARHGKSENPHAEAYGFTVHQRLEAIRNCKETNQ